MSLAEEMLANMSLDGESSAYLSGEQEEHIKVTETRQIIVPNSLKTIAVTGDKDIETVTFDCVRYWDGNDLSTFSIYLNYVLPDNTAGTYIPEAITTSEDEEFYHFDWNIKNNITTKSGKIAFAITAIKTKENESGETVVDKQWSSIPNTECSIVLGLDVSNVPSDEESASILAQMSKILAELQSTALIGKIVQEKGTSQQDVMSQNAVTKEFNSKFGHRKNYFNKETAISGYSISTQTGELVKLDGYFASDFIEVEAETSYIFSTVHTLAYYDENKVFISGVSSSTSSPTEAKQTPSGCKYLRFSYSTGALSVYVQLEKGTLRTPYEEYREVLKNELLYDVGKDSLDIFVGGKNLFNKNGHILAGYVFGSSDGVPVKITGYSSSEYIEVIPLQTYVVNTRRTITFFDENKVFISGIGVSVAENVFIAPKKSKYVVISFANENIDTLQLEKGRVSTDYEEFCDHKYINPKYVDLRDIQDLIIGKNLLTDDVNIKENYSISSSDGTLVSNPNVANCTESYVEIEPNTTYTFHARHTLAWYNDSLEFISGISSSDKSKTVISPTGARYIRFSWNRIYEKNYFNKGEYLNIESFEKIDKSRLVDGIEFDCGLRNVKNIGTITSDSKNLCLVAMKQIYKNGEQPDVSGYLYLDIYENKLYYSSTLPDNPIYLCDWDEGLAYSVCGTSIESKPNRWHFTITKDGDIICLQTDKRSKPIIYPHDDYNNPYSVEGLTENPYGFLSTQSVVQMDDGTFYCGDYTPHSLKEEQNNGRRYIWKVTPPYNQPENWSIDHSFKHVYFSSAESDEPDNEIGHIHSVTFDFYTNTIYANTGDIGRHVRIWRKKLPDGDWTEAAKCTGNGQTKETEQKYRAVNLLFTKDSCWWATDSFFRCHNLYKADRDANGDVDFDTTTLIVRLEDFAGRDSNNTQATYGNVLLRNPSGILMIDRAEDRADHKLDVVFYSFETGKAQICATFKKVDETNGLYTMGDKGTLKNRLGFANQCFVGYQPFNTEYIMTGGADYIRINQVDIFNNNPDNYVGALKLKIVRK